MTAETSQNLANVLREAGFEQLALRAEQDEFHDYLSPHAMPETVLASLLAEVIRHSATDEEREAASAIRLRLIDGEFDASAAESDAWAESDEGREAFASLTKPFKP